MAANEDLTAFFAKKARKSNEKKKGIISLEKIGHRLEKIEDEELELNAQVEQVLAVEQFLKSHENEDSEWLEYTNSNPMLAEDKKYAEMESTDSEAEDEKENAANQQAKTWNTTNVKPASVKLSSRKYVPPTKRENTFDYPTFEDAIKLEQKKKEEKKVLAKDEPKEEEFQEVTARKTTWVKVTEVKKMDEEKPKEKPGFFFTVKKPPTQIKEEKAPDMEKSWRSSAPVAESPPPDMTTKTSSTESKYIPPYLRKKQAN
uniref:Uncharacterized protein n=1 Tax=Acrobeloides nanus TaxID=290746 RepID=A0A914DPJ6_9BILA